MNKEKAISKSYLRLLNFKFDYLINDHTDHKEILELKDKVIELYDKSEDASEFYKRVNDELSHTIQICDQIIDIKRNKDINTVKSWVKAFGIIFIISITLYIFSIATL